MFKIAYFHFIGVNYVSFDRLKKFLTRTNKSNFCANSDDQCLPKPE